MVTGLGGIVVNNRLGIHDRVVLLIYCKGNREEAVHSGLMCKYGIDVAGSWRGE